MQFLDVSNASKSGTSIRMTSTKILIRLNIGEDDGTITLVKIE